MILLRTVGIAAAAILTALALNRVLAGLAPVRATQRSRDPLPVKLRQDPATGIYYPAE